MLRHLLLTFISPWLLDQERAPADILLPTGHVRILMFNGTAILFCAG
jgi:hypothetical protein